MLILQPTTIRTENQSSADFMEEGVIFSRPCEYPTDDDDNNNNRWRNRIFGLKMNSSITLNFMQLEAVRLTTNTKFKCQLMVDISLFLKCRALANNSPQAKLQRWSQNADFTYPYLCSPRISTFFRPI